MQQTRTPWEERPGPPAGRANPQHMSIQPGQNPFLQEIRMRRLVPALLMALPLAILSNPQCSQIPVASAAGV